MISWLLTIAGIVIILCVVNKIVEWLCDKQMYVPDGRTGNRTEGLVDPYGDMTEEQWQQLQADIHKHRRGE